MWCDPYTSSSSSSSSSSLFCQLGGIVVRCLKSGIQTLLSPVESYQWLQNTWRCDLEAETKRCCYTWGELERLAQVHKAWRAHVGSLCSSKGQLFFYCRQSTTSSKGWNQNRACQNKPFAILAVIHFTLKDLTYFQVIFIKSLYCSFLKKIYYSSDVLKLKHVTATTISYFEINCSGVNPSSCQLWFGWQLSFGDGPPHWPSG